MLKKELQTLFRDEKTEIAGVFSVEKEIKAPQWQRDTDFFAYWLSEKAHGTMDFLVKNIEARKNPRLVLPEAQTAIVFLVPYSLGARVRRRKAETASDSRQDLYVSSQDSQSSDAFFPLMARYARGLDYHRVLKKKLSLIAQKMQDLLAEPFAFRPVIDSIPFLDRTAGSLASLGFIGKNTMLIRPGLGSYFFIATLLTDLPYERLINTEQKEQKKKALTMLDCGSCTRCIDACPTHAIVRPRFLDARRCLSYLSIEHRGPIADEFIPYFANTVYGCDVCQDVCPYNFVTADFAVLPEFAQTHPGISCLTVRDVAMMSQVQYAEWFGGTAATRTKYEGLVRNAIYHLYAVGSPALAQVLAHAERSDFPVICEVARQVQRKLSLAESEGSP